MRDLMSANIHPTAIVYPGAELGFEVSVGAFCVIGPEVKIGDRSKIGTHSVVVGKTSIGAENKIYNHVSLGQEPQDLKYKGEPTELRIGDRNTIREFVSMNKGTAFGGGVTSLGSNCLVMACAHIGHDCQIGDGVILGNNVLLGGHCRIEEYAILNGGAAVNPFTTIGAYSYIGGLTRIVQDAPPFMVTEGHPARPRTVNLVGLERRGFTADAIKGLRQAFKKIYHDPRHRSETIERILDSKKSGPELRRLAEFLQRSAASKKGRYLETLRIPAPSTSAS